MLKDASNANNGYAATGDKDQKPLTMAVERVVVRSKEYTFSVSKVF